MVSASVIKCGGLLGFVQLEGLGHALLAMVAFGIVGILLVVFGFKVFDWLLPKIDVDKELEKGNIAVAIVMAAVVLGVSAVIVASIL